MFQKIGLLDILLGLWQRKIKIILIAVLALLIAIGSVAMGYINNNQKGAKSGSTYLKSAVYYVGTAENGEVTDPFSQAQRSRNAYISLLDSELCAEYLQNTVGVEKLSDYVLPTADAASKTLEIPDDNIAAIYKALKVEALTDSSNLRISFLCTDSQLGDHMLDACFAFVSKEADGKINPSTVSEIGRSSYDVKSDGKASASKMQIIKNVIKKTLVYAIVLEFIYLLVAIFIMIFFPVINRKNDLKDYSDSPVWEV